MNFSTTPTDTLSDYQFDFPPELVAMQSPGKGRTRILHVPRAGGPFQILSAPSILELLQPGDCLVVNDTKVIPARLLGRLPSGSAWEALLIRHIEWGVASCRWEAMVKPGRRLRPGTVLEVGGVAVRVESVTPQGLRILQVPLGADSFYPWLEQHGHIPLPPYIKRPDTAQDRADYQTVFSREPGAVAAPTASLHFSEEMVATLPARGVDLVPLTLHVGPGTFQNVEGEDYRSHPMHSEQFHLSTASAERIQSAKARGGRVIAVGTTSARVLETLATPEGGVLAGSGETDIFLYPGYQWQVVDGLITNFHWPRSTLILLVASFLGRERTLQAYQHAVENRFQLFSYGDGMLIL